MTSGTKDKPSSTRFRPSSSTDTISGNEDGPTQSTLLSESGSAHSTISSARIGYSSSRVTKSFSSFFVHSSSSSVSQPTLQINITRPPNKYKQSRWSIWKLQGEVFLWSVGRFLRSTIPWPSHFAAVGGGVSQCRSEMHSFSAATMLEVEWFRDIPRLFEDMIAGDQTIPSQGPDRTLLCCYRGTCSAKPA